jgi:L-asparaginase/Glu-tRNA(Gln) amidotransferase subunit D
MSILVITTGGTIGAVPVANIKHPPSMQIMPSIGQDYVRDALVQQFNAYPIRYIACEARDSKLIDEPYQANLVKIIEDASEDHILIAYGTDRILQMAEYFHHACGDNPKLSNKYILLTGAMVPLSNGPESDGYMNLEYALKCLTHDESGPGVSIVLCDFTDSASQTGWQPKLYNFEPGHYEKYYDADNGARSRIRHLA